MHDAPTLRPELPSLPVKPMKAAAGLAAGVAAAAWAVRGRSSTVFAPSFWRGPRNRPFVALTFDDGPSESTPDLLELLRDFGVSATFFQCGANVRRLPAVAREVAAAGHEIGNHSDTHPFFCLRGSGFIEEQVRRAQEAIEIAAGVVPRFFRPPYGVRWFGLREAQRRLGLVGVMWSVLGLDWKLPGEAVARRILSRIHNGAIVCLHDGRRLQPTPDVAATIEAVRRLVPALLARGFQFVTIGNLLCPRKSETG